MSETPTQSIGAAASRALPGVWLDRRHGRLELSGRLPDLDWRWSDRHGVVVGRGTGTLSGNRLVLSGTDPDGLETEWHLVWYAGALTGFVVCPTGEFPVKLQAVPTESDTPD